MLHAFDLEGEAAVPYRDELLDQPRSARDQVSDATFLGVIWRSLPASRTNFLATFIGNALIRWQMKSLGCSFYLRKRHFTFSLRSSQKKVENRRKISTDTRSLEKQYCLRGENKRSLGVDWEKGWNNIFRETEMKWKAQRNMKLWELKSEDIVPTIFLQDRNGTFSRKLRYWLGKINKVHGTLL